MIAVHSMFRDGVWIGKIGQEEAVIQQDPGIWMDGNETRQAGPLFSLPRQQILRVYRTRS